jgi:hypothetical protein
MSKRRPAIPKAVKDKVLQEFNHRCAICGLDRPQLHHIDEDPSNNEPLNLIPLCPNCHLTDQHNPTQPVDPRILRLFREFKDPSILSPQFYALFTRFQYLLMLDESFDQSEFHLKTEELIGFVKELKMGSFYANRISTLIVRRLSISSIEFSDPDANRRQQQREAEADREYILKVLNARWEVIRLLVELLRFQSW